MAPVRVVPAFQPGEDRHACLGPALEASTDDNSVYDLDILNLTTQDSYGVGTIPWSALLWSGAPLPFRQFVAALFIVPALVGLIVALLTGLTAGYGEAALGLTFWSILGMKFYNRHQKTKVQNAISQRTGQIGVEFANYVAEKRAG